jgi:hypothetical protein
MKATERIGRAILGLLGVKVERKAKMESWASARRRKVQEEKKRRIELFENEKEERRLVDNYIKMCGNTYTYEPDGRPDRVNIATKKMIFNSVDFRAWIERCSWDEGSHEDMRYFLDTP